MLQLMTTQAIITHAQFYIIVTKLGISYPHVVTKYQVCNPLVPLGIHAAAGHMLTFPSYPFNSRHRREVLEEGAHKRAPVVPLP